MSQRIRPEAKHYLIHCKRLINPSTETVVEGAFIEINNGKIFSVGQIDDVPSSEAEILNYSDKTILPGLIETHGHLYGGGLLDKHHTNDLLAPLYLAAGVTSVRFPGSMEPATDMALRDRIDSGRFLGPRLFLSGAYIEMENSPVQWMDPVMTAEEARLKIDHWIQRGATSVKIYAAMKGEILKAAIEHGHAHGVKVIAHVGAVSFREAIELGIDELFHGVICCPETWPPGIEGLDYLRIFEYVPQLDLATTELKDVLALAAAVGVAITPTTAVIQPFDPESRTQVDQKKFYSPEAWEKLAENGVKPLIKGADGVYKKQFEFIHMAYQAGCLLTTGTDVTNYFKLPGFSLWDEMEIFYQAGMPEMEVLKAATINGALALGRSDLLGSLTPGKLADMVVLDSDPLEDITNAREVHRVIKAGAVYEPQEIYEPLVGKIR